MVTFEPHQAADRVVLVIAGATVRKPDLVVQLIGCLLAEAFGDLGIPLAIHRAVDLSPDLHKLDQGLLREVLNTQVRLERTAVVIEFP
jgi:hypothetical protein